MSYVDLKAKANALTAEARTLRREENRITKKIKAANLKQKKVNGVNFVIRKDAHRKRTVDIRNEARAVHLARAFLKGTPYNKVEKPKDVVFRASKIDHKVINLVAEHTLDKTYGTMDIMDWFDGEILDGLFIYVEGQEVAAFSEDEEGNITKDEKTVH